MTSIIAFFILIGVLITVHEFGHFAVAKMCGVKCEVFSIGFGRPIIKFQRGETEYRLAWIPLGGYVRMLGQEPQENRDSADVGRSLMDKSPLIRILIYAAGPGMNLLLPFILIVPFIALSDQTAQVPSSDVGAVDSSMPAYEAGLRGGDKITRLDGQPVHAFWQIKERLSQYQPEQGTVKLGIERAGHDLINLEIKPRAIQSKHEFLGFEQTNYLIGYQVDALDSNIAITSQNSAAFKAGLR
ncbi:MAG: RIP metalloprotease RseP, partial [Myxococcales bacterium]|nr:RIP metalloprotease RseP [Myxococcales bacterium]